MTNPRDFEASTIISTGSGEEHKLPPLTGEDAVYKGQVVVNFAKSNPDLISSSAGFFLRVGSALTESPGDYLIRVGPAYVTNDPTTLDAPDIEFTGEVERYKETGQLWYRTTDKAFFVNDGDVWQRLTPVKASQLVEGVSRFSTVEEVLQGTSVDTAVSPSTLNAWRSDYEFIQRRRSGIQLYVDADTGTDDLLNDGRDPYNPFLTIERALLEVSRASYVPGLNNDLYDNFTVNISSGDYTVDNRPGAVNYLNLPRLPFGTSGPILAYTVPNPVIEFDAPLSRIRILDATQAGFRVGQEIYGSSGGVAIISRIASGFLFLRRVRGLWQAGDTIKYANYSYFNSPTGGVIVPRGCSLVAIDLRKTNIRPMYLGDISLADADPECLTPGRTSFFKLTGGCYLFGFTFADSLTQKVSHHLCSCVEFAATADIQGSSYSLYKKIFQVFGNTVSPAIVESDFQAVVAENEIVTSTLNNTSTDSDGFLIIDNVVSSSPYIYNCSLRSRFGLNGMLIDGSKATGLRSMVTAQFTNVSLQSDPNAFVEDLTQPGNKRYKPNWRHVAFRAINGGYAQIVSCFVICSAYHYETIDGGELSITNSCSNFGDYSLVAKGYSPVALSQDKGAVTRKITPPKPIDPEVLVIPVVTLFAESTTSTRIYVNGDLDSERISPFNFVLGEQIYIKGVDNTEYSATLNSIEPVVQQDSNGWFLAVSSVSNGIFNNKDILADFNIYIKRVPDFRLPDDRIYWLRLEGLNFTGLRRPVENFIVRFDENRVGSQLEATLFVGKVRSTDTQGAPLPPGTYEIALLSANGDNESIDDLYPPVNVDRPIENPASSLTYIATSTFLRDLGFSPTEITDLLQVSDDPLELDRTVYLEFNRPSLIRCSSHTWEWQGYLNYSSALPKFQDKVLSFEESVARIKKQTFGGRVYNTGMDQDGNFLIGDKLIDLKTGEEVSINKRFTEDSKVFSRVTITQKLLLFAGATLDVRSGIISVDTQTRFSGPIPADSAYRLYATTESGGLIEIATEEEALAGVDQLRAIVPQTLNAFTTAAINDLKDALAVSFATQDLQATNLVVTDETDLQGSLSVGGPASFAEDVNIEGSTAIDGSLTVGTDATFGGALSAGSDGTFGGDVVIAGTLSVAGASSFSTMVGESLNLTDVLNTVDLNATGDTALKATTVEGNFTNVDGTSELENLIVTDTVDLTGSTLAPLATGVDPGFIKVASLADTLALDPPENTAIDAKILNDFIQARFGSFANGIADLRLSLQNNSPIPNANVNSTSSIYLHPFEGNNISLYNTVRNFWQIIPINNVLTFNLNAIGCTAANTLYDLFAFNSGTETSPVISLIGVQDATITNFQGVRVQSGNLGRRFVGSVATRAGGVTAQRLTQSVNGGTSPSCIYLANAYNTKLTAVSFSMANSWTDRVTTNFIFPPGYDEESQCQVVVANESTLDAIADIYCSEPEDFSGPAFNSGVYVTMALASTDNPGGILSGDFAVNFEATQGECSGDNQTATSTLSVSVEKNYHVVQYLWKTVGPTDVFINEHETHGMTVKVFV
jgi:hypothetical protein